MAQNVDLSWEVVHSFKNAFVKHKTLLACVSGDPKGIHAEADEPMDLQTTVVSTPISPEQQQFQTKCKLL